MEPMRPPSESLKKKPGEGKHLDLGNRRKVMSKGRKGKSRVSQSWEEGRKREEKSQWRSG